MAVLWKYNARKASVTGPISVAYGNHAVPGLLENKHLNLTIGSRMDVSHPYYLRMTLSEAEKAVIKIADYLDRFADVSPDVLLIKIREEIAKDPFRKWD